MNLTDTQIRSLEDGSEFTRTQIEIALARLDSHHARYELRHVRELLRCASRTNRKPVQVAEWCTFWADNQERERSSAWQSASFWRRAGAPVTENRDGSWTIHFGGGSDYTQTHG